MHIDFFENTIKTKLYKAFKKFLYKEYYAVEDQNFGCDFAVYDKNPEMSNIHAIFLVYNDSEDIIRMNRASTILKKDVSIILLLILLGHYKL